MDAFVLATVALFHMVVAYGRFEFSPNLIVIGGELLDLSPVRIIWLFVMLIFDSG